MNIGIDIRSFLEKYRGGVSQYTESLLNALLARNRTHQYVLFSNAWRLSKSFFQSLEEKGAHVVCLDIPNKILNSAVMLGIGPEIDRLLGDIDVFWAPNLQFISLSKKCKSVITCHDLSFEHYPEFLSIKRRLWHAFVQPRRLYDRFDKIIAVSEATADDLMDIYQIPSGKIQVIHSGVDAFKVSEQDIARVKNVYHLPLKFFFTLGTLEPRKNLSSVLLAYDWLVRNNGIREDLVVVGAKGWKYKDIRRTWERLSSRKRIHFYHHIPDKDRAAFYCLASLFIWPSFYEGFGFPPLEACSMGTPAIVGHHSSFPEVVGNCALMVDPYNIRSIADAMESLMSDDNFRNELKFRGRSVAQDLTWDKTAEKMESLFESLVNNKQMLS